MTKISALTDIGTNIAVGDDFPILDISDPSDPNKKVQQQNLLAAGAFIPDGSTSVPGLRFSNDTDTGLVRLGDNQFAIVTSGSVCLVFNSDSSIRASGTFYADSVSFAGVDAVKAVKSENEAISIRNNAAFSVGSPGSVPYGIGPVVPPGTAFAGLGPDAYNPVHLPSASFC